MVMFRITFVVSYDIRDRKMGGWLVRNVLCAVRSLLTLRSDINGKWFKRVK